MTTNHTPGPWKKARNSSFWEVVTPFQCQLIDEANEFSLPVAYAWGCTEEEAEANASLIAAAPELLNALVEMEREKSDYMIRKNLGDPSLETTNKAARAAISKATGA